MDLNEIAIYVKVYETKSFVAAARALGMPKSTVSAKISSLEKRLGVTLIRRTTRKLFITDAGQDYYGLCSQALRQITAVEEQIGQSQAEPQGHLRVTAPVELGEIFLPEVVAQFSQAYPKVSIEFILTDRKIDLVAEGIDLAIRAGDLKDSTMISKKLGAVYFALFASPKYIKAAGHPRNPKDLVNHHCLHFTPLGSGGWELVGPKGKQVVTTTRRFTVNDLNLVRSLSAVGMGVALLPTFFCRAEIEEKRLVRILPDWRTVVRPVQFVYPHQEFVPRKLSAFLAIATEILRKGFVNMEG